MRRLPFLTTFHRTTVPEQAAAALRAAIQQGLLTDPLPGELQLARQLNISRPSVRVALAALTREKLVLVSHGRRTRLTKRPGRSGTAVQPLVCVVSPVSHEVFSNLNRPMLADIRAKLAARGIGWDELIDGKLAGAHPDRHLDERAAGRRNACWLLVGTSPAIQAWFQRANAKALVLGSCHPRIQLPSIDVDHRAIGWHAAGQLVQHGHSRIALILPRLPLAGDVAFHAGFLEYVARYRQAISTTIVPTTANAIAFRPRLSRLFAGRHRTTAVVTTHAEGALSVLVTLLRLGRRIPQDVSLISRETHPLLGAVMPELAHYSRADPQLTARAVRAVEALLTERTALPRSRMIIPTFVPGASLGRAACD